PLRTTETSAWRRSEGSTAWGELTTTSGSSARCTCAGGGWIRTRATRVPTWPRRAASPSPRRWCWASFRRSDSPWRTAASRHSVDRGPRTPMPALTDRSSSGGTWRWVRVGGVIAALGVFLFLGRRLGSYVPVFATWVNELGPWGPLAFIAGYAVSVVLLVPAVLL